MLVRGRRALRVGAGVHDHLAEAAAALERGDDGRHLDEAVVVGDRVHDGGVHQRALRAGRIGMTLESGGVIAMPS